MKNRFKPDRPNLKYIAEKRVDSVAIFQRKHSPTANPLKILNFDAFDRATGFLNVCANQSGLEMIVEKLWLWSGLHIDYCRAIVDLWETEMDEVRYLKLHNELHKLIEGHGLGEKIAEAISEAHHNTPEPIREILAKYHSGRLEMPELEAFVESYLMTEEQANALKLEGRNLHDVLVGRTSGELRRRILTAWNQVFGEKIFIEY